ncbi:malonyl-ACP O-methyltransferase BioC [Methylomonas sp. MgM2]
MTMIVFPDKTKVRRSFSSAARSYDDMAELQRRVGLELLKRFPLDEGSGVLLDLGCGTGFLSNQLAMRVTDQRLIALDLAFPMLQTCRCNYPNMAARFVCADAESLPFSAGSVAQIYSNLALQWVQDLAATLAGFKDVLKRNGRLVFAIFGPETLAELKSAWAAVDNYIHVNTFYDTEAIEGFLELAGFRNICCERVVYKSRYPSVVSLMRELKGIGAHNVNRGRNPKPTTKIRLQKMIDCYEAQMSDRHIMASYEIIFVKAES